MDLHSWTVESVVKCKMAAGSRKKQDAWKFKLSEQQQGGFYSLCLKTHGWLWTLLSVDVKYTRCKINELKHRKTPAWSFKLHALQEFTSWLRRTGSDVQIGSVLQLFCVRMNQDVSARAENLFVSASLASDRTDKTCLPDAFHCEH